MGTFKKCVVCPPLPLLLPFLLPLLAAGLLVRPCPALAVGGENTTSGGIARPGLSAALPAAPPAWSKKDDLECLNPHPEALPPLCRAAYDALDALKSHYFWWLAPEGAVDGPLLILYHQGYTDAMAGGTLSMLAVIADVRLHGADPARRPLIRYLACTLAEPLACVQTEFWRGRRAAVEKLMRQRSGTPPAKGTVYAQAEELQPLAGAYADFSHYYADLAGQLRRARAANLQRLPPDVRAVLGPGGTPAPLPVLGPEDAAFFTRSRESRARLAAQWDALLGKACLSADPLSEISALLYHRASVEADLNSAEALLAAALAQLDLNRDLPPAARREADAAIRDMAGGTLESTRALLGSSSDFYAKTIVKLKSDDDTPDEYAMSVSRVLGEAEAIARSCVEYLEQAAR